VICVDVVSKIVDHY